MAIEGDLRFISHLDCVRAIERTAARAKVPLQFSQGFNPHPILSLACPRPVGVATCDDLVMLSLAEEMQGQDLLRRLNQHAPTGMRFSRARPSLTRRTPRPRRISYQLDLDESKLCRVRGEVMIVALSKEPLPVDILSVAFNELTLKGVRAYAVYDFERATKLYNDAINYFKDINWEHVIIEIHKFI